MSRALLAVLVTFTLLLAGGPVFAQAADLQASVDADTVGVGERVQFTPRATTGGEMPTDPKPGALTGFHVVGPPSVSQTASMTIVINGVQQRGQRTVQVTWTLEAEHTGTFALGPPSVSVAGQRVSGRTVTIKVVPAGQAPPRRAQQQDDFDFSPFDVWKT